MIQINGDIPDIVDSQTGHELYIKGLQEMSNVLAEDIWTEIILPYQKKVDMFVQRFETIAMEYAKENHMINIMTQSLEASKATRSNTITLSKNKYLNHKRFTEELKQQMNYGHDLLLEIRAAITGQEISTKFMISVDNKTYVIDEKKIKDLSRVFSKFGGGTISNPFSLAYEMDSSIAQYLNNLVAEGEAEEISGGDIWTQIWQHKIKYLQELENKNNKKYNPFYDSKDAEIYMLHAGNPPGGGWDISALTTEKYIALRKEMGGGGGYATAFYKLGDIGLTQVKFFNIHNDTEKVRVNYARFSLIRDQFRKLQKIFHYQSSYQIGQALLGFFTEKSSNILSEDTVTQTLNNAAKQHIRKIFNL